MVNHQSNDFDPFLVNCEFGEWGNWTTCSKSCDGGDQTRQRSIATAAAFGGTECSGDLKETQSCNTQNCPSTN